MSTFRTLATCEPFIPGVGFRAELQTDGERYRLVSWDFSILTREGNISKWVAATDGDPSVATERAACLVSDYNPGAARGQTDAQIAETLCSFWSAYAERPAEFGREPGHAARVALEGALMTRLGALKRNGGTPKEIAEARAEYHAAHEAAVDCPPDTQPDPEQPHASWWERWSDYLTGTEDDEVTPINWTCPE